MKDVDTGEIDRKLRLKYLVDVYFPRLSYAEIHRRARGEQPRDGARGVPPVADELLLKGRECCHTEYRTFATYFEVTKPAPPDRVIDAVCLVLARDFVRSGATPAVSREGPLSNALTKYVKHGGAERGPLALLRSSTVPGVELDFQHLVPITMEAPATGPFAQLAHLRTHPPVQFLRGGPPENWSVLNHVAIRRVCEDGVMALLVDQAKLIVMTGAAGDGKTTILKRVGMKLREAGWRVIYCEAPSRSSFPSVSELDQDPVETAVLVDNADLAYDLEDLEDALANTTRVHVVLCSRAYRWKRKGVEFRRVSRIDVPRLCSDEIESLAHAIVNWGATDDGADQETVERRIKQSVDSAYPHLLAAMLSATRGRRFLEIVDALIADFEAAGDDWVLRLVAIGAYVNELSNDYVGRLPHKALFASSIARLAPQPTRRSDAVTRKLTEFQSEVIPLRFPGGGRATEYDLRHPDIWKRVLARFYEHDVGFLNRPEPFAEDLVDLGLDEIREELQAHKTSEGRWRPYIARILRFMFRPHGGLPIPVALEREVVESVVAGLGAFERELELKTTLLIDWATRESYPDRYWASVGDDGLALSDSLFERALQSDPARSPTIWVSWIRASQNHVRREAAHGDGGTEISRCTTHALCRRAWEAGVRDSRIKHTWFETEVARGNLGDKRHPQPFTARWVAREVTLNGEPIEVSVAFVRRWLELEAAEHNRGNFVEPEKGSARWIIQRNWERSKAHFGLLFRWFVLEVGDGNLGDAETPFSAGWIESRITEGLEEWSCRLDGNLLVLWRADLQDYLRAGGQADIAPLIQRAS
jgi:hypothetical protein